MAKEGSLSLDRQGRIIRFSHSLEDMLGFPAEEVLGREFACLAPTGSGSDFTAFLESVEDGGISARKTCFLCKDGSEADFYMSAFPMRDKTGSLYSCMLTLSSRKTGMPAILTEEFTRIFKSSNDAVAVTDKDGSIIDVNQAFLDTYGYERHEVLGQNPRVLKSSHSTKDLYEKMWQDILDPEKGYWKGEIINVAKNGKEVPVLLSINAIKDSKGEIRNFLGIAFNMTRQKELDKLSKMYIDYIVHDMRGPLTYITVNSELLLMQLPDLPEKPRKKIETILASGQKIAAMASDMLDFSRAQSGSLALKVENVKIADVLREAALPFAGSGKALFLNGAPFCESSVNGLEVNVDRDKLQRIIYNLLSNAFKHAETSVFTSVERLESGLKVAVSDDGKGISSEDADRIFDAFYQTKEGVKTGGAGLGLSIVKSFVEAHGGNVSVEAGREKGVTFVVTIPG